MVKELKKVLIPVSAFPSHGSHFPPAPCAVPLVGKVSPVPDHKP